MCVYLIIRKGSVTHTDSVVAKGNIEIYILGSDESITGFKWLVPLTLVLQREAISFRTSRRRFLLVLPLVGAAQVRITLIQKSCTPNIAGIHPKSYWDRFCTLRALENQIGYFARKV